MNTAFLEDQLRATLIPREGMQASHRSLFVCGDVGRRSDAYLLRNWLHLVTELRMVGHHLLPKVSTSSLLPIATAACDGHSAFQSATSFC